MNEGGCWQGAWVGKGVPGGEVELKRQTVRLRRNRRVGLGALAVLMRAISQQAQSRRTAKGR